MRKYPLDIIIVAKRIAASNGVSVDEVFKKFETGSRKSAYSRSDFFWGHSDISLGSEKVSRRISSGRRSTRSAAVSRGI